MKLIVTFPKEKEEEVVKSLQETAKQVENWNKSKITKGLLSLSSKLLNAPITAFAFSEYTLIDEGKIYWNLNMAMEGLVNKEEIAARLNDSFKKRLGEGASVKLWKEILPEIRLNK